MRASDVDDAFHEEEQGSGLFYRLLSWFGAALAVAIVVGLGTWFSALGEQDPREIPVISASLSVVKERPEDTGPAIAHADMQSYDAGAVKPGLEQTTPLPGAEAPAEDDRSMGELAEREKVKTPAARVPIPNARPNDVLAAAPAATPVLAPAADGGQGDDPAPALDIPGSDAAAGEEEDEEAAPGSESPLAPVISVRAPTRPAGIRSRVAAAAREGEVEARSEIDRLVAMATTSTVQVQLGAFPDKDYTIAEWKRIQRENADILKNRTLVLQTTESGGRLFYRLRVGPFRSRSEAESICAALKSRRQPCLVASNG